MYKEFLYFTNFLFFMHPKYEIILSPNAWYNFQSIFSLVDQLSKFKIYYKYSSLSLFYSDIKELSIELLTVDDELL